MSRFFGCVALMILPLFFSGCSETQPEAEHEHHDDHGARPTLESVVKRVRKQYRWAVQAASRDDAKHFQHELEHFHESVQLLPRRSFAKRIGTAYMPRRKCSRQRVLVSVRRNLSQRTRNKPASMRPSNNLTRSRANFRRNVINRTEPAENIL